MDADIPKENTVPAPVRGATVAGDFSLTADEQRAFEKWSGKHRFTFSSEGLIWHALEEGKTAFIKYLVSQGHGKKALSKAAHKGKALFVKTLVEAGVDINAQAGFRENRETPLMRAVHGNHMVVVLSLITFGADLDIQNGSRNTALILAVLRGRKEIAVALVKAGADPDVLGAQRRTAIGWAAYFEQSDTKAALVKALEEKVEEKAVAKRLTEKREPQSGEWEVVGKAGQELVIHRSGDEQGGTSVKDIFDFNAGRLLTTVISEGNQMPLVEKLFSEIDPDFLKQAEEKRSFSQPQP